MKVLRRLPDDVGDPVEVASKYRRGNTTYIVHQTSGGRMIYAYEDEQLQEHPRQEAREVVGVLDVLYEEEIQQPSESQESSSHTGQDERERETTAPVSMPFVQELSPLHREITRPTIAELREAPWAQHHAYPTDLGQIAWYSGSNRPYQETRRDD